MICLGYIPHPRYCPTNTCDSSGDTMFEIDGKRVMGSDFKEYRKFSPQFRDTLIIENAQRDGQNVTAASCTCSKCGRVAMDQMF